MTGAVAPARSDAKVVQLSTVQMSQGAVVHRGVAHCHVPVHSCSCQLIGRRHWRVSPCHDGSVVLARWHSCYIVWDAGHYRESKIFLFSYLSHDILVCYISKCRFRVVLICIIQFFKPVLIFFGGLLMLLHLSDDVETMML